MRPGLHSMDDNDPDILCRLLMGSELVWSFSVRLKSGRTVFDSPATHEVQYAQMAELADAPVSEAGVLSDVGVRVPL